MTIERGLSARVRRTVSVDDTAEALGSGDLPVLGTPRLVAWCGAATCAAIVEQLDDDATSVGTRIQVDHKAASAVGDTITATATVTHVDGRLLNFEVVAAEQVVAHGEIRRVVVRRDRFMDRFSRR